MESLENYHRAKIGKIIIDKFNNDDDFYSITVNILGVSCQGFYRSDFAKELTKRKFKLSISESGYLYFEKTVAGVLIQFVLTSK